ncbi:soluble lytic murein transglycosylase [Alkalispirillum mobile]|uniref:Soluble lytic murein transglycosylase n=2 Tax=Alkalispirillum mobile TaxID=85925 RepID=A0A498C534_9GAMM|nr:soluble lytic murein transglycosylase [Alkalispirillum mobile]
MRAMLLSALVVSVNGAVVAAPDDKKTERELFKASWERLAANRPVDMGQISDQLADYPLLPYLHYRDLRNRLSDASASEVQGFLDAHDLPVNRFLRNAWLRQKAAERDWKGFIAAYEPEQTNTTLECHYLEAQAQTAGLDTHWVRDARALWTVGHSQPDACDPVFDRLYERGILRGDDAWARIEKAMDNDQVGLAGFVARRLLSDEERALFRSWERLHSDPTRLLDGTGVDLSHPRGGDILAAGLRRLGVRDPDKAWQALDRHARAGHLKAEQVHDLRRHVALRAAYSHRDTAWGYLEQLERPAVNKEVRLWRARVALGRQDWQGLEGAIADLPAELREQDKWRYWAARADLAQGQLHGANEAFSRLADTRSYYGFLAADHALDGYAMPADARQPASSEREREALAARTGVARAHEFFRLGMWPEARREWQAQLSGATAEEREAAAELAHDWGWHDRAIFTAHHAGLHHDVALRFPTPFRDQVEHHARQAGLDPAFVFAIIRKESAFMTDARSHAGALGLMQVMPGTGREVARRQGRPLGSTYSLLDPDTSLRIGTAYLAEMMDRYEGNAVLAAAAYNAGPRHVDRWLEASGDAPADVWVERITFRETRGYVKDVLAWTSIFSWQLGREPVRVATQMRGGTHFASLDR